MKPYSITRRLVTTVLLVQLVLTGSATAVSLVYERNQLYRAFDVMLRGRADTVFAAVQDAEDAEDNVVLETSSLDIPHSDLYEVSEESSGRILGRSAGWQGSSAANLPASGRIQNFIVSGKRYRGIVMHGTRLVDSEDKPPGVARKILIVYAAPTSRIWHELWEAARFLTLFNSLLLLLTAAALILLLRRSMAPLNALAAQAAQVSARSWSFEAPPEARAARELTALVNALDSVLKRLERSFLQQRNFVHDAAHELKTAVTVVKSSLQLVDYKERTVQEYRAGLSVCLADCERMEDLVQRLLTLARADQLVANRDHAPASQTTNVVESLRDVAAQLESVARMRDVFVECSYPEALTAGVFQEDFMILATNLILNAIQHSAPGSCVQASLEWASSDWFRMVIKDTGEGIPAEHLPFVFERFYRGDASRSRQTGGTGLGLAICHAIVEAYGGRIVITSQEHEGTAVTVELPAAPNAAVPDASTLISRQASG